MSLLIMCTSPFLLYFVHILIIEYFNLMIEISHRLEYMTVLKPFCDFIKIDFIV